MNTRAAAAVLGTLFLATSRLGAQIPAGDPRPTLPRTTSEIPAWDAAVARRAAAMIASPAQWNRSDPSPCSGVVKSISLRCALERAADALVLEQAPTKASTAGANARAPLVDCRMTVVGSHDEGSCGPLFDEATVFSVARTKAITTGAWRTDSSPSEVWAGQMINGGDPVLVQARQLVNVVAPGKYRRARLAEFNNDSTVTFVQLQAFFRSLEERVSKLAAADVATSGDDVEIELYRGGAGVIRTYNGWYAVSGFAANDSTVRFQFDTTSELAPNTLDREILKRADALLSSDAVWNRADDRTCPPEATKWSIYCALEHATREVTGGFHHRRPALELVRVIVEDRTKGRNYDHRLMDYNNDQSTHLADVRSLFAEALARIK